VINTNLPPILHRFQVMADYCQISVSDRGVPHFNALARGDPPRISESILPLLESLSYLTLKTAWSYHHLSGENTGMWPKDGWTDGRTDRNGLAITAVCIASRADAVKITNSIQQRDTDKQTAEKNFTNVIKIESATERYMSGFDFDLFWLPI